MGECFFFLIWDNSDVKGGEQANFTGFIQLDFHYWYCYFFFSLRSTWALLQHSDLREVRSHVTWWVDFLEAGRKQTSLTRKHLCT